MSVKIATIAQEMRELESITKLHDFYGPRCMSCLSWIKQRLAVVLFVEQQRQNYSFIINYFMTRFITSDMYASDTNSICHKRFSVTV